MLKKAFLSFAALGVLGVTAGTASAQCSRCNTGGSAIATATENVAEPLAATLGPVCQRGYVASNSVPFRWNPYQPRVTRDHQSPSRTERWQYAKTDPRKYRN